MPELYTPEWEKEEFNRLAPELEERIKKQFAGRGAFFGGMNKLVGSKLARLAQEIASQSATARYNRTMERERFNRQVEERKRQEGVAMSERTRQENVAAMERSRQQSLADLRGFEAKREAADKNRREFEMKRYEKEGVIPSWYSGEDDDKKRRGFRRYSGMAGVENESGFVPVSASGAGYGRQAGSYSSPQSGYFGSSAFTPDNRSSKPVNYRYEIVTKGNRIGQGDAGIYSGETDNILVLDRDEGKIISWEEYLSKNPRNFKQPDNTWKQDWQNKKQDIGDDGRNWFERTGDSITEGWKNFTDTFGSWFSPEQKRSEGIAGTAQPRQSPFSLEPEPIEFGNPENGEDLAAAPFKKMRGFAGRNPYRSVA